MKFYQIIDDHISENGSAYFATLAEAKAEAKAVADYGGHVVTVERVEIGTDKDSIIALANGRGWCKSSELVYTAKARVLHDV